MDPVVAPPPAASPLVGIVDSQGNVSMVQESQLGSIGEGFSIATPAQLALHAARQEQAGPVGALKAFGESAASTATFGTSTWLEKELGISDPVDIRAREAAHPISSFLGATAGVLAPAGAEKALANVGEHGLARVAGGAPGLISDLGEGTTAALRSRLTPASRLGRIGADVLAKGAGSTIEGAAYGLGQSVSEDALDPNLTVESALARGGSEALLNGAFGLAIGTPFGLVSSALKELPSAANLADRLERFQGENDLRIAGANQADINRALKKMSREDLVKQASQAREILTPDGKPILDRFNSPEQINERASEVLDDTGQKMQEFVQRADAKAAENPKLKPDLQQLVNEFRETLAPLEKNWFQQSALKKLSGFMDVAQANIDREATGLPAGAADANAGRTTVEDLWHLRRDVSEAIYGWRGSKTPGADRVTRSLQDLRGQISNTINATIEKTGEDTATWKDLNRTYQVASNMQDFSGRALNREMGNNRISLTETGALLAGATHGPLGLAGAGAFIGLKRFGPDLLSMGAQTLREALPEAPQFLHAKNAVEKAAAVGAAPEPLDLGHENQVTIGGAPEDLRGGNTVEKVAALSALERVQREALQEIHETTAELVDVVKASKGAAAPASKEILETIQRVNRLANMPEHTADLLTRMGDETHEHAPGLTSKTGEVGGRMFQYLQSEAPQSAKPFPMGPELQPERSELLTFQQKVDAVKNPIEALRRSPTKTVVDAIAVVYPTLLQEVRSSLIAAMATIGHDRKLTQPQRTAVSNILGVDIDGSQDPQLLMAAQAAYLQLNKPMPKVPHGMHSISVKTKSLAERMNPSGTRSLRNP